MSMRQGLSPKISQVNTSQSMNEGDFTAAYNAFRKINLNAKVSARYAASNIEVSPIISKVFSVVKSRVRDSLVHLQKTDY